MPTANENKCCKQHHCVTTSPTFENLVMSRESLHVAIVGRADILVDAPLPSAFWPSPIAKIEIL